MRRIVATVGFAIAGFFSLITWASIDAHICALSPSLCQAKLGTCTEIDHCPPSVHMIVGLVFLVFGPPVLFGIVGGIAGSKHRAAREWLVLILTCVATHWALTFLLIRVIKL
jgi:hypothetical protein